VSAFARTRWSLVVAAGEGESPQARAALATLCETYWLPLYAFARRTGASPPDAEDLVQGFFASLLERNDVGRADPARGRFRTYLIASFRHHASHVRDRARAAKRGGGRPPVSIDGSEGERRYALEPSDERTPERIYERQWALAVLAQALAAVRTQYARRGRSDVFEELRPHLLADSPDLGVRASAERLGTTEGAVRVAVHRLRGRYRVALRRTVLETIADPSLVDEEIGHLVAALA
jgi:RNA polymerase sigma-70 factor (ECF subfamily)